jgi:hypothetical protein
MVLLCLGKSWGNRRSCIKVFFHRKLTGPCLKAAHGNRYFDLNSDVTTR